MVEFLSINIDAPFVQFIVLRMFSKQAVNNFSDMVFPRRAPFFILFSPPLTGEQYVKMESKYPEAGPCQSVLRPRGVFNVPLYF